MAPVRAENTNSRGERWARPKRDSAKPFTQVELQALKPGPKLYTLFGPNGLAVAIAPTGSKLFRYHYRTVAGKATTASLGQFPHVTLKEANSRLAEIKSKRARGVDPNDEKRRARAAEAHTFEATARAWVEVIGRSQKAKTNADILSRLEKHVFPTLGRIPIAAITSPLALPIFEGIVARGHVHAAKRVLQYCSAISDYAQAKGLVTGNVFGPLRGCLPAENKQHFAAITAPKEFGRLLVAIDEYEGDIITRFALKLAPLFFLRSTELRTLKWSQVNWDEKIIEMKATDKKEKRDHIVPLCRQALQLLSELRALTGNSDYILASSITGRALSNMTLNVALRRMGFAKHEMTTHGFRAAARTMLAERLGFHSDQIELQSARKVRDGMGDTYNRTQWLAERTRMMQDWADYCDRLRREQP